VGQDAEVDFIEAGGLGSGAQVRSEQTFDLGETALDLPALPVVSLREALLHGPAKAGLRQTTPTSGIDRKNGSTDPKNRTCGAVKRFAVVSGVAHQCVRREDVGCLRDDRGEIDGVVAGTAPHHGRGDEMGFVVAQNAEFEVRRGALAAAVAAFQEVRTDVAGFHTGGVNRGGGMGEPALPAGPSENGLLELFKDPFFRRRCSAFWSVVKWGTFCSPSAARRSDHSANVWLMRR